MSDLPQKPAAYDTPAMLKWLEAHVEHLMDWKRSFSEPQAPESPLAIADQPPSETPEG